MFSSGTKRSKNQDKDTIRNIESSREFVVNLSTYQDRLKMVQSSTALEYGESEAEKFQIETEASSLISVPRIKSSPINLECRYIQTLELSVDGKPISSKVVFGRVVGINISEGVMTEGGVDVTKLLPIARLGGDGYALISDKFNIPKA
jgi:flavin reductase (DIM6/NTAB) family NADH-FMN oxidoreductase RutF